VGGNDADIEEAGEPAWILETTVLSAFALAGRLDILRDRYRGCGTWTIAVHDELMRGVLDEPRLGDAVAAEWLGEPRAVFDVARVEQFRLRLGGRSGDKRHLGEATCIVLAQQIGAGILLDDRDAKRVAEGSGIGTGTTISVLKAAITDRQISAPQAKHLVDDLIDRDGRRLPRLSIEQFRSKP
jgi:predicted nucleic acid-binding protein